MGSNQNQSTCETFFFYCITLLATHIELLEIVSDRDLNHNLVFPFVTNIGFKFYIGVVK